ncbi:hypothetical protein ABPG72_008387 [Tetrahymena utriculariae]
MIEQYLQDLQGVIFLRKFDMFSQPYYHRVDYNQKTKKTAIGGLLSICIIGLSLAYLIYILYLFFSGSYTPSITTLQENQAGLTTQTLTYSPFAFCFRSGGQIITTWKDYFEVYMYLDNNGNSFNTANYFSIKKCEDVLPGFTNLASYYCIDTTDTPTIELKTNQADPTANIIFNFALFIKNGKSPGSIVNDPNYYLEFAFIYQRFFTDDQKLELVLTREQIVIDPALFVQDQYDATQTQSKVDDGFLLSSWKTYSYISDFRKTQSYLTQASAQTRFGKWTNGSGLIRLSQISLNDQLLKNIIQYPKISIVLAQFQSIFSTLLIAGIIAKIGSENKNVEESIEIVMNNYYKKSAIEIDQYLEQKKKTKKHQTLFANNQIQAELNSTQDQIKQRLKIKNRLFDLYDFKIMKHYYTDCKRIKDDEPDPQVKGFKKALEKSWSMMNAHQIHLEILKLKTAIQMLLTDKQYASLDFIGRRLFPSDQDINHLELLDKLDENENLRVQKALEYFEELNKIDQPQNPLDQKFKSSLLRQVFEGETKNDEENELIDSKRFQAMVDSGIAKDQ